MLSALAALVSAAACSGGNKLPSPGGGTSGPTSTSPSIGPCTESVTQACHAVIGEHAGIVSCYAGTQTCASGTWSACENGRVFHVRAPGASLGTTKALSYSTPQACVDDVCNPYCQQFTEVPEGGGLTTNLGDASPDAAGDAGQTNGFNWTQGSSFGYPPGLLSIGAKEPCDIRSDCQFNMHCVGPAQDGCDHGVCEVGSALAEGCNPCATEVCGANPSCCVASSGGACTHDPCVTGAALTGGATPCDPCVASVCANSPSCCSMAWDSSCIALVQSLCAPRTCTCAPGQIQNGDDCYLYSTQEVTWDAARSKCQALGTGVEGGTSVKWDLATISDPQENALILALPLTESTWLVGHDNMGDGNWVLSNDVTEFYSGFAPTGSAVNGYFANWAPGQPDAHAPGATEDCVDIYSTDGTWNNDTCNTPHAYVCEGPPPQLGTSPPGPASWTQTCVDDVERVCGSTCPSGSPPANDGVCEPWFPEETDPSCATSVDLGVGFGCNDGTNDEIPICNHGGLDLQANTPITLLEFPAGSTAFGSSYPTGSTGSCTVSFPTPLKNGFCQNANGTQCPGLTDGMEIMVNPPGPSAISECHSDDNWSIFNDGSCGKPVCSGNSSRSDIHAVHLMVVLDVSGSMAFLNDTPTPMPPPTRWTQATSALKTFFSDPKSAGLYVALRFFPSPADDCGEPAGTSPSDCNETPCETPSVNEGKLTAAFAPTDVQEAALLNALSSTTPLWNNHTPTYAALEGAYAWVGEQQVNDPTDQYVVVLVTDGEPQFCSATENNVDNIAGLAANAYKTGVLTYAIGIEDVSQATLNKIATAGVGGPNNCLPSLKPNCAFFVCSTSDCGTGGADAGPTLAFSQQLVQALDEIAGHAVSCSFDLPNTGNFDPTTAQVEYLAGQNPAASLGPYCPANTTRQGDECYEYSQVKETAWSQARADCQAIGTGWDLMTIDSARKNTFANTTRSGSEVWIGLNDQAAEGNYAWSSGECFSYKNWKSGQPDNGGAFGSPQNCVTMGGPATSHWDDVTCTQVNGFGALCEGPIQQPQGGCGAGEIQLPGALKCFKLATTPATFANASAACSARAGWTLAALGSTNVDVAHDIVRCTDALVAAPYPAPSPALACPDLQADGTYKDDCTGTHPYLCEGPLPPPTPPVAPPATPLTQVSSAAACTADDQWYYDNTTNPTVANLCPATCSRVSEDSSAQVSVQIACKPPTQVTPTGGGVGNKVPVDTSHQVTYVSSCTPDERTQWDFLWYETTTPGTSTIAISARTADSQADLINATPHALIVADTADGTSSCPKVVPGPPMCPVSLFDKLMSPDQYGSVLELDFQMTPGSKGEAPVANSWQIAFSCVPGQ